MAKPNEIKRKWYLINAEAKVLGRLSTMIAKILSGKHKVIYTPSLDTGDGVIVINADKIKVTGSKLKDKLYLSYSGYPSGLKKLPMEDILKKKPSEVLRHAVKGMLPKNALGRHMLEKLKIYPGPAHPHSAQELEVTE